MICTSPRSGSTLLCRLLAATRVAGAPDSHFHDPSLAKWLGYYGLTEGRFADSRALLAAVFDAARARGAGDTGIFGLRMQGRSFGFFLEQLRILHPQLRTDSARIDAAFGETLFIHLTRANKLEQAISYVKATHTGLWHKAPDGTELERLSAPREPVYDAAEIAKRLAEMTALDEGWDSWFEKENLEPLRLTYDALSVAPCEAAARILGALGLDPQAAKGISPSVVKLADAISLSWAQRFVAEGRARQGRWAEWSVDK